MSYVDGFLLAMSADGIDDYRKLAELACTVWKDHGALDYKECLIDDDAPDGLRSFRDAANASEGEAIIFAFITYRSREHRDEVNEKVMADSRMSGMSMDSVPFETKRMAFGGFKTIVEWD